MITLQKGSDEIIGAGALVLPRVNLLPPEIAQAHRLRRVQTGLAGGVVAALVVVGGLFVAAGGSIAASQESVDAAAAGQQTLLTQTAQYRDVTATYRRATDAQALLVAAMGDEVRYSRLLNDLSLSIPDGVWLTSASFVQTPPAAATPATAGTAVAASPSAAGIGTLTVSGTAYEYTDVALWLDALAGQEGYAEPLLQSSTASLIGTKKVVDWSTTVTLTTDALSGRFTTPGGS